MKNKPIPTAESMLDISFGDNVALRTKISGIMIAFAKFHVEEALKQASEKATAYRPIGHGGTIGAIIQKDTILDAYPLDNIK